jgi:hypothetical protein
MTFWLLRKQYFENTVSQLTFLMNVKRSPPGQYSRTRQRDLPLVDAPINPTIWEWNPRFCIVMISFMSCSWSSLVAETKWYKNGRKLTQIRRANFSQKLHYCIDYNLFRPVRCASMWVSLWNFETQNSWK